MKGGYFQSLFGGTGQLNIDPNLSTEVLDRAWNALLRAINDREKALEDRLGTGGSIQDATTLSLDREIGIINEKLDLILQRIEDAEPKIGVLPSVEMKNILDGIVFDLRDLEHPITRLFEAVEGMKKDNHREANDYYRQ